MSNRIEVPPYPGRGGLFFQDKGFKYNLNMRNRMDPLKNFLIANLVSIIHLIMFKNFSQCLNKPLVKAKKLFLESYATSSSDYSREMNKVLDQNKYLELYQRYPPNYLAENLTFHAFPTQFVELIKKNIDEFTFYFNLNQIPCVDNNIGDFILNCKEKIIDYVQNAYSIGEEDYIDDGLNYKFEKEKYQKKDETSIISCHSSCIDENLD